MMYSTGEVFPLVSPFDASNVSPYLKCISPYRNIINVTYKGKLYFLRKSQYFAFWMFSAKQGHYWYHLITSLTWRGPWLGIEPEASTILGYRGGGGPGLYVGLYSHKKIAYFAAQLDWQRIADWVNLAHLQTRSGPSRPTYGKDTVVYVVGATYMNTIKFWLLIHCLLC